MDNNVLKSFVVLKLWTFPLVMDKNACLENCRDNYYIVSLTMCTNHYSKLCVFFKKKKKKGIESHSKSIN